MPDEVTAAPETAPTPATVAASTAPQTPAAPAIELGAGPAADPAAPWNQTDPEKRMAAYKKLQDEAGSSRIQSKKNAKVEALRTLAAEVGVELPDEEAVTPEALSQKLSGTVAENATLKEQTDNLTRTNAALLEAWRQGVPASAAGYLAYKLSTDPAFAKLDTTADTFGASLTKLVTGMVAADSMLKATGVVTASGPEKLGGSEGTAGVTPEAFAAMSIAGKQALKVRDPATYTRLVG